MDPWVGQCPAIVHGGEMVLPVGVSRVLAQMLEGFRLGPAALPQAPYHYGQMYRSLVVNRIRHRPYHMSLLSYTRRRRTPRGSPRS